MSTLPRNLKEALPRSSRLVKSRRKWRHASEPFRTVCFGDLAFYTVDEQEVEAGQTENDLFSDSFEYEEPNEIPGCLWADELKSQVIQVEKLMQLLSTRSCSA